MFSFVHLGCVASGTRGDSAQCRQKWTPREKENPTPNLGGGTPELKKCIASARQFWMREPVGRRVPFLEPFKEVGNAKLCFNAHHQARERCQFRFSWWISVSHFPENDASTHCALNGLRGNRNSDGVSLNTTGAWRRAQELESSRNINTF